MTFIQNALNGCPCTYITEAGKRCDAQYFFDENLLTFIVLVQIYNGCAAAEFKCLLSSITEVGSLRSGKESFPAKVLGSLSPEESELMLRISYVNEQDDLTSFYLLEVSSEASRILLESLRVLRLHAIETETTLPGQM